MLKLEREMGYFKTRFTLPAVRRIEVAKKTIIIFYTSRLAVVIKQMLQTCAGVCVVMTSLSMKTLHPVLRQFNGRPLFTAHFSIPELKQVNKLGLCRNSYIIIWVSTTNNIDLNCEFNIYHQSYYSCYTQFWCRNQYMEDILTFYLSRN